MDGGGGGGGGGGVEERIELPPGFRFHPTDEELITHYLARKAADAGFAAYAVGEADFNRVEPWELPLMTRVGEKEWYFFCLKDRKYPTGLRTNRATKAGYWKATGKDKEVYKGKAIVGMKKTLVFYLGRAPRGEKSSWVMHEYRLEGSSSQPPSRNEWVICRVFKKCLQSDDSKPSGLPRPPGSSAKPLEPACPHLPSLTDLAAFPAPEHVPCFSTAAATPAMINPVPDFFSDALVPASVPRDYYYQSGSNVSLVQLLHGGGGYIGGIKGDGERGSASQDTGLTSDINPEISSSAPSPIGNPIWHY